MPRGDPRPGKTCLIGQGDRSTFTTLPGPACLRLARNEPGRQAPGRVPNPLAPRPRHPLLSSGSLADNQLNIRVHAHAPSLGCDGHLLVKLCCGPHGDCPGALPAVGRPNPGYPLIRPIVFRHGCTPSALSLQPRPLCLAIHPVGCPRRTCSCSQRAQQHRDRMVPAR